MKLIHRPLQLSLFLISAVYVQVAWGWSTSYVNYSDSGAASTACNEAYKADSGGDFGYCERLSFLPVPAYRYSVFSTIDSDGQPEGRTRVDLDSCADVEVEEASSGRTLTSCTTFLYQWPCASGQIADENNGNLCVTALCPSPFDLSSSGDQCEAFCTEGQTWDPSIPACVPAPEQQNCETQSDRPVDFFQGRKYRDEPVLATGKRFPLALNYRYNNHGNREIAPTGAPIAVYDASKYLAATTEAINTSDYENGYRTVGVPKNSSMYSATQAYGDVAQYWRHNFDEVLLVLGGQFHWHRPQGQMVVFSGLGISAIYPHLELSALSAQEATFAGYQLTNHKNNIRKQFDSDGRLLKIVRDHNDSLTLSYDIEGRLERVSNSEGAFIQLGYTTLPTDSVYSVAPSTHDYPVSVTNDRGEKVQIQWGKVHQGQTAKFHLITHITEPATGTPASARTFEYNDPRFGASLTDTFFVDDIAVGSKEPLLHFVYDEQGRAIYSGTVAQGGSDSVEYVDELTRVVTNALGKKAVYEFADISGARRLQKVTGEPTQNCLKSEVEYEYDANGNVWRETQNGQITEYGYDSRNRETSRTEAAGTPDARTITTEYHPTLNKPVKITEPGKVTTMTYDAEGRLLSNTTQSTVAP